MFAVVGISLMYKNIYGLDYSNATKATIVTPSSNYTVVLPWHFDVTHTTGGYISWGDGAVEEMTAAGNVAANLMRHTYYTPGQYEIAWIPIIGVNQIIGSYRTQTSAYTFGVTVRNYTQFSDQIERFTSYGNSGLQRIDGVLPVNASGSDIFRDCTNLNYINPEFFSNVRSTFWNLSYAFQNTTNLTSIDPSLLSGLTNIGMMPYCFDSSGITNFSATMFASMTKVTDCSYAFRNSKIQKVTDNMFFNMRVLANVTGMFMNCKNLTTIGSSVFRSSAVSIPATSVCEGCTSLITIQATSFSGLANITVFSRAFYGCAALTALPYEVFSGLSKVTTFAYGCYGCTSLNAIPLYAFDSWTALIDDGMSHAFQNCIKIGAIDGGLFRHNNTLTNLTYTFHGCASLKVIPLTFFRNMPQLRVANGTFAFCGLTTLPLGLFTNIADTLSLTETFRSNPFFNNLPVSSGGLTLLSPKCTNISYCFGGNNKRDPISEYIGPTRVPADMLNVYAGATGVNVSGLFAGCSGLTTVPGNLFTSAGSAIASINSIFSGVGSPSATFTIPSGLLSPLRSVTDVSNIFYQAYLTDIPADVFTGMPQITDVYACFVNYTGTTIPAGLFANNPNLTNVANCFAGAQDLVSIPANLFANNPKITNTSFCFMGGLDFDALETVPETLFDPCPLLEDVGYIFYRRRNLANVGNIFRRNPLITNFSSAFSINIGTGSPQGKLTGVSPVSINGYKLWERAGKSGYPATVSGASCFARNGTLYSDYNNIPSAWKQ